jgi:phage shock protein B
MQMSEGIFVLAIVTVVIGSIFVALPWMILHYIAKARSSKNLTDEDERMLQDLWRSARTMERRIETLERLIEPEAEAPRARPTQQTRGDIN